MKKLILMLLLLPILAQAQLTTTTMSALITTYRLEWTATGDDGNVGRAISYSLRYDADSLNLINDWDVCVQVPNMPVPDTAGATQGVDLILDGNQVLYFAIKAVDDNANWSAISNIVLVVTDDDMPPARIIDLRVR